MSDQYEEPIDLVNSFSSTIIDLVKKHPNDQELGRKVRGLLPVMLSDIWSGEEIAGEPVVARYLPDQAWKSSMICDYCDGLDACSRTITIFNEIKGNRTFYSSYNVCQKKQCDEAFRELVEFVKGEEESPLSRYSKAEVQEQHFFYLNRWIESNWSDEFAKQRMEELMAVMLTWKHFREDS